MSKTPTKKKIECNPLESQDTHRKYHMVSPLDNVYTPSTPEPTKKKIDDLKPFEHGQEGTHYACQERSKKLGGKVTCCGCTGHKCKPSTPEPSEEWVKKIIKEYQQDWKTYTEYDAMNNNPTPDEILERKIIQLLAQREKEILSKLEFLPIILADTRIDSTHEPKYERAVLLKDITSTLSEVGEK